MVLKVKEKKVEPSQRKEEGRGRHNRLVKGKRIRSWGGLYFSLTVEVIDLNHEVKISDLNFKN